MRQEEISPVILKPLMNTKNKWEYPLFNLKRSFGFCHNIKKVVAVFIYLFDPAAPCSYSLPVSAAPAVPFVIPLRLAFSAASFALVLCFPGSTIFSSLGSLLTAVGSCSFILAGVIGSFSLYSVNGSSFLPTSVPGPPSSNLLVRPPPLLVEDDDTPLPTVSLMVLVTLSLASVILSLVVEAPSLVVLATLSLAPLIFL